MYHCGNYAIVFCYYRLKRLINVSLLTGWPFAKVRPELVLSWPVFFLVDIILPLQAAPLHFKTGE